VLPMSIPTDCVGFTSAQSAIRTRLQLTLLASCSSRVRMLLVPAALMPGEVMPCSKCCNAELYPSSRTPVVVRRPVLLFGPRRRLLSVGSQLAAASCSWVGEVMESFCSRVMNVSLLGSILDSRADPQLEQLRHSATIARTCSFLMQPSSRFAYAPQPARYAPAL